MLKCELKIVLPSLSHSQIPQREEFECVQMINSNGNGSNESPIFITLKIYP